MKIYLAAKYPRRFELRPFAEILKKLGHEMTCQWLWNAEESKGEQKAAEMDVGEDKSNFRKVISLEEVVEELYRTR